MSRFLLIISLLFLSLTANALPYDYSDTHSIPIKLRITKEISTANDLTEGDEIFFKLVNSIYYKGEILAKKGDIVSARIETIITKGFNGFPAEIIIDNFEFDNIESSKIMGTFTKVGANRCYWVYPIKWALTPIPFAGSVTNFILGGEAKIKTDEIITIYYYPNWK